MRYVSTLCRLSQTPRHIYIFGISTTSASNLEYSQPPNHPTDNIKMRYVCTLCRLDQTPSHIYIFGISTTSMSILEYSPTHPPTNPPHRQHKNENTWYTQSGKWFYLCITMKVGKNPPL